MEAHKHRPIEVITNKQKTPNSFCPVKNFLTGFFYAKLKIVLDNALKILYNIIINNQKLSIFLMGERYELGIHIQIRQGAS